MTPAPAPAAFAFADAGFARARGGAPFIGPAERLAARGAVIDVAVGIVRAADGRVLLAERTARQVAAGFWELPGGKIDAGETPLAAVVRELDEEIGIAPHAPRPWTVYEHAFKTKRVRLHFFHIDAWSGTPHGREGQRLAWVDPAAPAVAPILPSNDRVLAALGVPPLCMMAHGAGETELRAALDAGVRFVVLREPPLATGQRVAFARRVAAYAERYAARIVLAGTALEARRAGLGGVHSSCAELRRATVRPPIPFWSATAHDAADLARAVALGADLAIVSPVLRCASDPQRTVLGWDGLARLAAGAPIPIFARGGLTPALLEQARSTGAAGIVVSRLDP